MKQKYNYMIKSIQENGTSHGGFRYTLRKNALIRAKDWNDKPIRDGGIFGLIHDTKKHYIQNNPLWIVMRYKVGTEVIVEGVKIKVPHARMIAWGTSQEIQKRFGELTGKPYIYHYAVQAGGYKSTQTAGHESTQTAGCESIQTAGRESTQTAGDGSIQTAGDGSIQTAGYKSTQIAGYKGTQTAEWGASQTAGHKSTQTAGCESIQTAGRESTQTAGDGSIQTAGYKSTQTAGYKGTQTAEWGASQTAGRESTQTAGKGSTQSAGDGSVATIIGVYGYCQHTGSVLQILRFVNQGTPIFLSKVITDSKKHRLTAVKSKNGRWRLKDEIIKRRKENRLQTLTMDLWQN